MPKLPSGLPDEIAADEDIARFLVQSSHFNSKGARPAAFLPNPNHRETSVCRHAAHPLVTLWLIGQEVAKKRNRRLYGAAILKASSIVSAGVDVIADEPPDRHAAIRGWPWIDNDVEMQRARQQEIAMVLVSKSLLYLNDGGD